MQQMLFILKTMVTVNFLKWLVFTIFPLVTTVPLSPFAPRPLCNFQLALANQACAYLPSTRIPPSPPLPFAPVHLNPPPPPVHPQIPSHSHGHGHGHNHRHQHGHDELGTDLGDNETHVPEHGHNHPRHEHHKHVHRHHHHHHHHRMSPVEQQCCKWLAQVDDECVCELLAHLPPFLARPIHEYTVRVAGSCNTTYTCAAQLRL